MANMDRSHLVMALGIYIREGISFKIRDISLFIEGEYESLFVEATYIIGEIYRGPNPNVNWSLERLSEVLEKLKYCNLNVIVGTDQNFDLLKVNCPRPSNELHVLRLHMGKKTKCDTATLKL